MLVRSMSIDPHAARSYRGVTKPSEPTRHKRRCEQPHEGTRTVATILWRITIHGGPPFFPSFPRSSPLHIQLLYSRGPSCQLGRTALARRGAPDLHINRREPPYLKVERH